MKLHTDHKKYTFSYAGAASHIDHTFSYTCNVIHIDRHHEPWITLYHGIKAIHSLMCELDAARVVLQACRELGDQAPEAVREALKQHDRLVEDNEPPSEWTTTPGTKT